MKYTVPSVLIVTFLLIVGVISAVTDGPDHLLDDDDLLDLDTVKANIERIHGKYDDVSLENTTWTGDNASTGLDCVHSKSCTGPSLQLNVMKRAKPEYFSLTHIEGNQHWYGNMYIDQHKFKVVFDTRISDILVVGPRCRSQNCAGRVIYDPGRSKTLQRVTENSAFSIRWGSGPNYAVLTGARYVEEVSIDRYYVVKKQVIGVIDSWDNANMDSSNYPFDAIFGLGPPGSSVTNLQQPTFIHRLLGKKKFSDATFALRYTLGKDSEISLGHPNLALFNVDQLTTIPLVSKKQWRVWLEGFTADFQEMQLPVPVLAAIDSGAVAIYAERKLAASLYRLIGGKDASNEFGSGAWTYPCGDEHMVTLRFGGRDFFMHPDTFNLRQVSRSRCIGAIVSAPLGENIQLIVGTVFLRNVYSVFHMGSPDGVNPPSLAMAQVPWSPGTRVRH